MKKAPEALVFNAFGDFLCAAYCAKFFLGHFLFFPCSTNPFADCHEITTFRNLTISQKRHKINKKLLDKLLMLVYHEGNLMGYGGDDCGCCQ